MTLSPQGKPGKGERFPLTPHRGSGQWCKKIRGRIFYFGAIADRDAALRRYLSEKDDLTAGRKPRPKVTENQGITLLELCNKFLTFKQGLVDSAELSRKTFRDYHDTCQLFLSVAGKDRRVDDLDAMDFQAMRAKIARGIGPVHLSNRIRVIRIALKFAYDSALIDRPVRYGQAFNMPRKQILRAARQELGSRMLEADQIRHMLGVTDPLMRAMILLGVNCGFGGGDLGQLPQRVLDLDGGWVEWPRPKTSIERRCPLWPETVNALRKAIKMRVTTKDKELDKLVFLTHTGACWYKDTKANPLSAEFRKLLNKTGLYRRGLGFYSLRRTFETIAGSTGDQIATDLIMGHADASMAAVYRQRVDDERLLKVSNHVHDWLFLETNS